MVDRDAIELSDARALRAYAHPIRMRLVGLLRREGALTATRAGELLDESSGTMSFHLRQLAKYGLVEEAGGGQGREKPWRATAQFTHLPLHGAEPSPEANAALSHVLASVARRYHELVMDWITRRPHESRRWQRAAPFSDYMLYVTPAELTRLGEQIDELLLPYARRAGDRDSRPKGSRLVTFLTLGLPAQR